MIITKFLKSERCELMQKYSWTVSQCHFSLIFPLPLSPLFPHSIELPTTNYKQMLYLSEGSYSSLPFPPHVTTCLPDNFPFNSHTFTAPLKWPAIGRYHLVSCRCADHTEASLHTVPHLPYNWKESTGACTDFESWLSGSLPHYFKTQAAVKSITARLAQIQYNFQTDLSLSTALLISDGSIRLASKCRTAFKNEDFSACLRINIINYIIIIINWY